MCGPSLKLAFRIDEGLEVCIYALFNVNNK